MATTDRDPDPGPLLGLLQPYLVRLQARLPRADFRGPASLVVSRDARGWAAGKSYSGTPDAPVKESGVTRIDDVAAQIAVPDAEAMADLLAVLADDPAVRLVLSRYRDGLTGEGLTSAPFRMLSKASMTKAGAPAEDAWWHRPGRMSCAPKKATLMAPTGWLLLDRDIDAFTPPSAAAMTTAEWLATLRAALPGLDRADVVTAASISTRVRLKKDGSAPFNSNGIHAFVLSAEGDDLGSLKGRAMGRLAAVGHVWQGKPPEEGARGPDRTLFDAAVIGDVGRFAYEGAPSVTAIYDVAPREIAVHRGAGRSKSRVWMTLAVQIPAGFSVSSFSHNGQTSFRVKGPSRARQDYERLSADVMITIETGGRGGEEITMSAAELEVALTEASDNWRPDVEADDKRRGQAPFRASTSWAAIVRLDNSGRLSVHDTGAEVTYRAAFPPVPPEVWVNLAGETTDYTARRRLSMGAMRSLAWHSRPEGEVERVATMLARRLAKGADDGRMEAMRVRLMLECRVGQSAVTWRNRVRERAEREKLEATEDV